MHEADVILVPAKIATLGSVAGGLRLARYALAGLGSLQLDLVDQRRIIRMRQAPHPSAPNPAAL